MRPTDEIIANMLALQNEVQIRSNFINNQLSMKDRELVDIYHYIEFNNLDVVRGFKAYKELQSCLKERREIKNEKELLDSYRGLNVASAFNKIEDKINNPINKTYTPRVREDLFPRTDESSKVIMNSNSIPPNMLIRVSNGEKLLGEFDTYEKAWNWIKNTFGCKGIKLGTAKNHIKKAYNESTKYFNLDWNFIEKIA